MAKKFTEFNKGNLDEARALIQSKLDELAELGLIVKMGNISYGADSFTSKLTTTINGGADEFEVEYNRNVKFGACEDNLVGLQFQKGTKLYTFRGMQPRARKNAYLAENGANNGLYKFSKEEIMKLLKASNPTATV